MGLYFQICLALFFMSGCQTRFYEEGQNRLYDEDDDDMCFMSGNTKFCRMVPDRFFSACFPLCTNGTYFECHRGRSYTKICAIEKFRNRYGEIVPVQMVFDPSVGRCVQESVSCPVVGDTEPEEVSTGCIRNTPTACRGKASKDYIPCEDSECPKGIYYTCSNGQINVRACPAGLKYDSKKKRCQHQSEDCPANTATTVLVPACISNSKEGCRNVAAGDYAACDKTVCRRGIYYSCANNYLTKRYCPKKQVYDTDEKSCQDTAVNCPPEGRKIVRVESDCISNRPNACLNVPSGDYAACSQEDCRKGIYFTCSNDYVYARNCPASLVYNSRMKRCEYESEDCPKNGNSITTVSNANLPPSMCVTNSDNGCQGKQSKSFPACALSECTAGIYYACDNKPYPRTCQNGKYFDKSEQKVFERPMIFDNITGICMFESTYCPLPENIVPKPL